MLNIYISSLKKQRSSMIQVIIVLRSQSSNAYQVGIAQKGSIRLKKNTNKYGYLIY